MPAAPAFAQMAAVLAQSQPMLPRRSCALREKNAWGLRSLCPPPTVQDEGPGADRGAGDPDGWRPRHPSPIRRPAGMGNWRTVIKPSGSTECFLRATLLKPSMNPRPAADCSRAPQPPSKVGRFSACAPSAQACPPPCRRSLFLSGDLAKEEAVCNLPFFFFFPPPPRAINAAAAWRPTWHLGFLLTAVPCTFQCSAKWKGQHDWRRVPGGPCWARAKGQRRRCPRVYVPGSEPTENAGSAVFCGGNYSYLRRPALRNGDPAQDAQFQQSAGSAQGLQPHGFVELDAAGAIVSKAMPEASPACSPHVRG